MPLAESPLQPLNFRTIQPNCLAFADPYVEHDPLTLLLDLILLKREVYRHLLFNRGQAPRHLGKPDADNTKSGGNGEAATTKVSRGHTFNP